MNPLVSIIIPTYNSRNFIKETIQSALGQSYLSVEIIVVDDGSNDGTVEILKFFGNKIRYISSPRNQGESIARNKGLKESKGEYIVFLDGDDILAQEMVQSAMDVLHNQSKFQVTYGLRTSFRDHISRVTVFSKPRPTNSGDLFPSIAKGATLVPGQFMVARQCLNDTGGFREDIRFGEDWELLLRLAKRYAFIYVPKVFVYKRRYQGMQSLTKNRPDIYELRKKILDETFGSESVEIQKRYWNRQTIADWYRTFAFSYPSKESDKRIHYFIKSLKKWPFQPRIYLCLLNDYRRKLFLKPSGMTVALLSSGLGHVNRGVETWTADLSRELNVKGVKCKVYKGGGEREHEYETVIPCLKRSSALSKWLIRHRPGFMWRFGLSTTYTLEETTFAWNILPELILKRYDIIHTQDPDVAAILQRVHELRVLKSRIILAHGTEEPFEFLRKFDYIQHLAPFHLEESRKYEIEHSRKYEVRSKKKARKEFAIGNFVDTDVYKPGDRSFRKELNIPEDAFVILSVAAIKRTHKRIDYLIDEVSKMPSNVYLVVAGAITEQTGELAEYGKAKLGERVKFLKDYPHEKMPQVYQAADVFALCSLKEMMPIALLEATSSGLPALVHKYPVHDWIIGDGRESIDMVRTGELAETLRKYMNSQYREEKGERARQQAVTNFSKEVIVEQIIKMYKDVLEIETNRN